MLKSSTKIYLIIFLLLSFDVQAAKAITSANLGQIIINSDNLIYDKLGNVAFFDGNVILWFNDMVLKTTNIKIYYKQIGGKNKIDKIIIPEKLTALKNKDSDILIADKAIYFFDKGELALNGNVILQHEDNILKTDRLVLIIKLEKIDNH